MISSGLTKGTGGNISIFNREQGLVAISPSGLEYYETKPEDVVILNLDGEVVEGERKPSSELDMHLIYYRKREDINALVHTHSLREDDCIIRMGASCCIVFNCFRRTECALCTV